MILQLGKVSTIKQIFGSFKKGSSILRRTSSLTQYYLDIDKRNKTRQFTKSPKSIIRNPIDITKCFISSENSEGTIDRLTFNNVCTETLDSLSEYFEELIESVPHLKNADVTYSDGVLTVNFGKKFGTYVINRQTPNLQIWLSSPISGPKRYNFLGGAWVYKHDKTTLHALLDEEIKEIANKEVEFVEKCSYAKVKIQ